MFKRILSSLGLARSPAPKVSADFERVAEMYLNLVKSRVIGALVVKEELLVPAGLTPEAKFGLLTALCAYFTARTDAELELRGVPEDLREYVWASLPTIVLDEMGFSGSRKALAHEMILRQTGLIRGVMESNGNANAPALARAISVMSRGELKSTEVDRLLNGESWEAAVSGLLAKYERYLSHIDRLSSSPREPA